MQWQATRETKLSSWLQIKFTTISLQALYGAQCSMLNTIIQINFHVDCMSSVGYNYVQFRRNRHNYIKVEKNNVVCVLYCTLLSDNK